MKIREDKWIVKLEFLFYLIISFFQDYPFWTFTDLMHGHSSWSTFDLRLVKGPETV
jgi:hypothetical protein